MRPARPFRKRFDDLLGEIADAGSVHQPGRCCVRELPDGVGNPAPSHRAVVIAGGRKLVGTRGALFERLLAVAFEHQVGGTPDIDLGYHAT